MRLSPKALSRMEKALTKGTSPVLTAAAIGRESHDIKCMAALELFLESDGQMDAVEAAYIACNAMQMQAVADAVHRGVIVEKAATALIIASVIAAILIIAYYFPPMLELYHAIGELALPSATNVLAQTLEANAAAMRMKMMIGVGGLLDVLAGDKSRAPERFQRLGLEWLYRLYREPRRFHRMLPL
ncbi:MAG: WecB/TagA/CpsF family glycosyltransferase, partial [Anaerotignum sp.]|nr:WecB/TagA/CpsF family glycosyltransferase [Anaerotignum sp.]